MATHQELDARSLAMHRLVAEKIRKQPELIEIARANVERWLRAAPNNYYLQEWRRILGMDLEACLEVVTDDSERAIALRQSTPFPGVLSVEERAAFLADWRSSHPS